MFDMHYKYLRGKICFIEKEKDEKAQWSNYDKGRIVDRGRQLLFVIRCKLNLQLKEQVHPASAETKAWLIPWGVIK